MGICIYEEGVRQVNNNSTTVFKGVVLKADRDNFTKLRKKHFPSDKILVLAKAIGLNDLDMVGDIESGDMRLDDRTYSLFLLVCGEHPSYQLIDKKVISNSDLKTPLAIKPPATGEEIKQYRENANSMRQGKMAWLLGLSSKKYVSYYENKEKTGVSPSIQCWTLFLLITSQHSFFSLKSK